MLRVTIFNQSPPVPLRRIQILIVWDIAPNFVCLILKRARTSKTLQVLCSTAITTSGTCMSFTRYSENHGTDTAQPPLASCSCRTAVWNFLSRSTQSLAALTYLIMKLDVFKTSHGTVVLFLLLKCFFSWYC